MNKFEIRLSRFTLFVTNALFGLIFFVIINIHSSIPILKRAGGSKHIIAIKFVTQVAKLYPLIYVLSIVLSWIFFFRGRHKLATFCAFLPLVPGAILLYASIKFSVVAEVYRKMGGEIIKGVFKLPGKILFPFRRHR